MKCVAGCCLVTPDLYKGVNGVAMKDYFNVHFSIL